MQFILHCYYYTINPSVHNCQNMQWQSLTKQAQLEKSASRKSGNNISIYVSNRFACFFRKKHAFLERILLLALPRNHDVIVFCSLWNTSYCLQLRTENMMGKVIMIFLEELLYKFVCITLY